MKQAILTDTRDLAEEVLEAAKELITARLRPREGWHNHYRYEAERRYHQALIEYARARYGVTY